MKSWNGWVNYSIQSGVGLGWQVGDAGGTCILVDELGKLVSEYHQDFCHEGPLFWRSPDAKWLYAGKHFNVSAINAEFCSYTSSTSGIDGCNASRLSNGGTSRQSVARLLRF
jgi:hypothetical protein